MKKLQKITAIVLLLSLPITVAFCVMGQSAKTQKTKTAVANKKANHVSFNQHTFDTYTVDFSKQTIKMYWKNAQGEKLKNIETLKKYVEVKGKKLVFSTNAGMYMPDNSPQGLYIENKKELVPIDLAAKGYGNFYMQPNGVFLITKKQAKVVPSTEFEKHKKGVLYATQSGPMLVTNGQINSHFTKSSTNVFVRSGVGINKNGEVVFAISNEVVNFYDFASLFKEILKCDNALYLDGAISEMYLLDLKRPQTVQDFGAMIAITE
ncbi:Uncharacterized protein YigE, DUF2233 family [Flexibacter flexilis DSM 6793]|uniref:Uncharacterized protein YigE, DUF2233 family n=1 Tax=Flexibacter flexilis DSM 6793 TaxID=927664 RepID=A0A1I1DVP7_9BACT|nr:phosphodiester glycosidase family protein [Flexibacter flexilis]SFB76653.1 Uncharacterized protein YigE, DUF2233 family [Flexibacter flexilis DSM 6793]